MVTGDLRGRGRPGVSSLLAGLTAIVTVGLDLLLIPAYGANGAALASAVAYTVFGVGSLVAHLAPVRHRHPPSGGPDAQ